MRKIIYLFIGFFCLSNIINGQSLTVKNISEIKELSSAQFLLNHVGAEGDLLFLTKQNFEGIFSFDLKTKELKTITTDQGAGYGFVVSNNGEDVFYRSFEYDGPKRFFSLLTKNLISGEKKEIVSHIRDINPPQMLSNNRVGYLYDGKIYFPEMSILSREDIGAGEAIFTIIQNRKIVLYNDKGKRIIEPFGEGIYIWPSLSPKGDKLLFTFASKGTFISDLDGNIITELGYANAPVWSADGQWIAYMVDRDDGHVVIDSDIWITSLDGKERIKITNTPFIHEMYPIWGVSNKQLFFTSNDGRIFEAELVE